MGEVAVAKPEIQAFA